MQRQDPASNVRAPRLFGIPAAHADIVAVIQRGPTDWCQVGQWNIAERSYQAGSWFKGRIFPQRCDLSPDGRWLCYMAHRGGASWELGDSYIAISRCPWLTALAAWGLGSTYSRGLHFVDDPTQFEAGAPDVGDLDVCRTKFGIMTTRPVQFAVEHRRGWLETADCEPRHSGDMWDERREVRMQKDQSRSKAQLSLTVEGKYAGFRDMDQEYWEPSDMIYALHGAGATELLDDVQWADWSQQGHLLVATCEGKLQIREMKGLHEQKVMFEQDLTGHAPEPSAPPPWAKEW